MNNKHYKLSLILSICSIFLTNAQTNSLELLRSKESTDYVWVVAHRADYVFAPENSIQALNNAIY